MQSVEQEKGEVEKRRWLPCPNQRDSKIKEIEMNHHVTAGVLT
jgi:hypothetical protein